MPVAGEEFDTIVGDSSSNGVPQLHEAMILHQPHDRLHSLDRGNVDLGERFQHA